MANFALVLIASSLAVCTCSFLRQSDTTKFAVNVTQQQKYTINDKILINGKEVAAGDGIDAIMGCNTAPQGATTVSVCGCGVKVEASLLTECQPYGKYSHEVGHCDCGNSACDEQELMSGYTDKFNWHAASFKVIAC